MTLLLTQGRHQPYFWWAKAAMRLNNHFLYITSSLNLRTIGWYYGVWKLTLGVSSWFFFPVYYLGEVKWVAAGDNWNPSAGIIGQLTQNVTQKWKNFDQLTIFCKEQNSKEEHVTKKHMFAMNLIVNPRALLWAKEFFQLNAEVNIFFSTSVLFTKTVTFAPPPPTPSFYPRQF